MRAHEPAILLLCCCGFSPAPTLLELLSDSSASLLKLLMCVVFYLTCSLLSWALYYGVLSEGRHLLSAVAGLYLRYAFAQLFARTAFGHVLCDEPCGALDVCLAVIAVL